MTPVQPQPENPFLGDFLVVRGGPEARVLLEALEHRGWPQRGRAADRGQCRQVSAELAVCWRGGAVFCDLGGTGGLGIYHPAPLSGRATLTPQAAHEELAEQWKREGTALPRFGGGFCSAFWDAPGARLRLLSDPFRSYPFYYFSGPRTFACATDLRLLLAARLFVAEVDPDALYHYLNFGYVPGPWTILKGVAKVPPGSSVEDSPRGLQIQSYWEPSYPEDITGQESLADALRDNVVATVSRYQPSPQPRWGTFLSGGTDSSTVAGILSRRVPEPLEAFSIVFGEQEFDERLYMGIAARRFGLAANLRQVDPAEAREALPEIIDAFDEPFGNASAIPTFFCATMAEARGVQVLMAGDGGDEIFGGNERYRKDKILGWYHRAPRLVKGAGELLARGVDGSQLHLANRIRNFVHRGSLGNPERFYSDDSFASEHFEALLTPDLRARLRPEASLDVVRDHFRRPAGAGELHRLMYVDLKMAIADCDLVKVTRASKRAGIAVSFPFLDPELVSYTGRLPPSCKVRGLEKRYLFRRALKSILPAEILAKRKHGFGLPFSVWLREEPEFLQLYRDAVLSERALARGYFNPGFIESLLAHHLAGQWDHGSHLYALLALELWHRAYFD